MPAKPTSAKANAKRDIAVSKGSSNQRSKTDKLNRLTSLQTDRIELAKHLQNIRNIILHSNATPFRRYTAIGYHCSFCKQHFTLPKDLKKHTLQKHDSKTKSQFMKGCTLTYYAVKLDITGLKCEICQQDIDGLEPLMEHLQLEHDKTIHTDIKNQILPFKFEGVMFKCVMCPKIYDHFLQIKLHMNVHYNNYICEICNTPHVNRITYNKHVTRHRQGETSCSFCPKVFDTNAKKLSHEKSVHILGHKRTKCLYCDEKFSSYIQRQEHMVKEHNVEPLVLKCMACEMTFNRRDRLHRHIKRDHLLERKHECKHCDMKFYGLVELKDHMSKHTDERPYKCDICLKAFKRKDTLREHLRIHADDRRFKCEHCGPAFVQRCGWRSHMRTRHHIRV